MNTQDGHGQLADGVASAANWFSSGTQVQEFSENVGQDWLGSLAPLGAIDPDGS